jgi:hypothetical protein
MAVQPFRNKYMRYGNIFSFAIESNYCFFFSPYRLCIETPRTGTRLLQTGDEALLKLAEERE